MFISGFLWKHIQIVAHIKRKCRCTKDRSTSFTTKKVRKGLINPIGCLPLTKKIANNSACWSKSCSTVLSWSFNSFFPGKSETLWWRNGSPVEISNVSIIMNFTFHGSNASPFSSMEIRVLASNVHFPQSNTARGIAKRDFFSPQGIQLLPFSHRTKNQIEFQPNSNLKSSEKVSIECSHSSCFLKSAYHYLNRFLRLPLSEHVKQSISWLGNSSLIYGYLLRDFYITFLKWD